MDGLLRHYDESLDFTALRRLETMEEFCSALKKLGAKYYDDADVSKEVEEFRLRERDTVLHKKKP
jgi:hypothetical protein